MARKAKKAFLLLLLALSLGVFAFSASRLLSIGSKYAKDDRETAETRSKYVAIAKKTGGAATYDPLDRKIDFAGLKRKNPDVAGWIYIPGTRIDEAILQGKSNSSYLHKSISGRKSFAGEVFMDSANSTGFTDDATILYGHNMKNGSRFHDLRKFDGKAFFESHRKIYVYLPDGSASVYTVFAAGKTSASGKLYSLELEPGELYRTALACASRKRSTESPDERKYLMCSTCSSDSASRRRIVCAALEMNVKG